MFLCVFGCQMLVSDQIQEIAAAYVSCHTVRDGEGERKRWKDVYTLCVSKRNKGRRDGRNTACRYNISSLSCQSNNMR